MTAARRRRRSAGRRGWVVVGSTLTAAAAVVASMALLGMGPNVAVVVPVALLIGGAVWLLEDLGERAVATDGVPSPLASPPAARVDRRLTVLRNGIAYGRADDVSIERLRATLVELVDDQLMAVHDVDRRRDPQAAARILGPELSAFVDEPTDGRLLTRPRSLDRIITLIEDL